MRATVARRRWTADDEERLTELLGRMPLHAIGRRLDRSANAVKARISRIGLCQRTAHYTAHAVADELGISLNAVCYLIRSGQLRPLPYRSRWRGYLCWHIEQDEIERFIRGRIESPRPTHRWRWQQMPDGYFRNFAISVVAESEGGDGD